MCAMILEGPKPFSSVSFLALLACTFPLCPTTSLQKTAGSKNIHRSNYLEASKNNRNQPSAHRKPPFTVPPSGDFVPNLQSYFRIGEGLVSAPNFARCGLLPPPVLDRYQQNAAATGCMGLRWYNST